ncbi:SGNH/GDSL hydrolase family protein [Microlunatus speluncae]|uniref:SGNH/GDSL hydrolase family protein n=1 Tax=Microlunatus speluncae TaxID=2594267 RepID=UPI0013760E92|nr:SGNH/GDSL hydrolase family protein [Microlunatus speluncae]
MTDWQWHRLGAPEGKGWPEGATERRYDRLPRHAEGRVPDPVWELSRQSSSLYSRFRTDATEIRARWRLGQPELAKWHMANLAVSGLDLYGDDATGAGPVLSRWVGSAGASGFPESEDSLAAGLDPVERAYTIYFGLFNRLEEIELGVPAGADFELLPPDPARPVVYYGTSIVHGAAASRPGMTVPAQLGRRLGRPVIGLGFSGNGRMEVELAELVGEIDAALWIVDCLPNMSPEQVAERTEPFVAALRELRPAGPILLVEDRTLAGSWARSAQATLHRERRAAHREGFRRLVEAGVKDLHYLAGDSLLGEDREDTVDGSHPTDLGFTRMADRLEAVVVPLLDQ